jgi:hypothetical protein
MTATPGLANPGVIRLGITGALITGLEVGDAGRMVGCERLVAAATREMPPRPKARASQAAQHRRAFSWSNGASASYFCLTLESTAEFAIMPSSALPQELVICRE